MKNAILIAAVAAFLAGCSAVQSPKEMPANNGAGADEMKGSPCACMPVDYDGRGFSWLG